MACADADRNGKANAETEREVDSNGLWSDGKANAETEREVDSIGLCDCAGQGPTLSAVADAVVVGP